MKECCKICGRNGDLVFGRSFTEGNDSIRVITHEPACLNCLKRLVLFGTVSPSSTFRQNVSEPLDGGAFPSPVYGTIRKP